MKKEKTKSPVEVDWRVSTDGSKIVFFETPDGPELAQMTAERFGLLLNGEYIRGLLQETAQQRAYPAEWGLREYVAIGRLLRKGLGMPDIARLWGVSDTVVRTFYGASLQEFQRDVDLFRQEAGRQVREEGEQDFCQSLKRGESKPGEAEGPGHDFLSVAEVSRLLKEHYGILLAVSSQLMLDPDDFRAWVAANKKYLDLF